MNRSGISRREFLTMTGAGLTGLAIPLEVSAAQRANLERLRFGMCADVHHDVMHDGETRMKTFVDEMNQKKPNFVIQLGDFCGPHPKNQDFLDIWNGFKGPRYHVIGNHDTDGGFKRPQTVKFWGMTARYYSFDAGGFHFVVLDGNDVKPGKRTPGYPRFIAGDQLDWLKKDLGASDAPTVVFCHQSLEDAGGVENCDVVRGVLETANRKANGKKIVAALSGHHHIDYQTTINDITYVQVNSMSYYWTGIANTKSYTSAIHKNHRWISKTCPYQDPLYAMVTLDPEAGVMRIEGRDSTYVGPSPQEVGYKRFTAEYRKRIVPKLSERKIKYATD